MRKNIAIGSAIFGSALLCLLSFTVDPRINWADDLSPVRTPEEELTTFQIEPGLKVQLVAAEPMVEDPVVMTFDADGRLWVVEMRGYMPDISGEGENRPVGRVSVLEDTNGDGQMDISKVYLDSLIMPRALALVPGGVLVAENGALWMTKDLDGDLKADTKTVVDPNYMGNGLPEHAPNGLWRGIDNWYYNAKSRVRFRLVDGTWKRDTTEFRGQWGICHDDKGRLLYNYNWSQLHGDLVPPNYLSRNKNHKPTTGIDHGITLDRRVYPIRPTPAVNRGYIPGTLDKEGRLQEFTAACSPFFYRGKALPSPYYGNVFVCEPAGNLIKRNVMNEEGVLLTAHDPHPGTEFMASTDERFRPVALSSGPDGALYVVDMYRGVIQHEAYVTPYLKEQTLERKLEKPINRGRIWRIIPEQSTTKQPKMLSKLSSEELVKLLSNPDGWYRDMAQQLLVERNDKRIATSLIRLAQKGTDSLGRFHALWTLEGLKLTTPNILLPLLSDRNSLIRITAIRLLEPFATTQKTVQALMGKQLLANRAKATEQEILQMTLSASVLEPNVANSLLTTIVGQYGYMPLIRDAAISSVPDKEFALLKRILASPNWKTSDPSKEIFIEVLTNAILKKRNVAELTTLLTMLDSGKGAMSWQQKAILTSMSIAGMDSKVKPVVLSSIPRLFSHPSSAISETQRNKVAALFEWPGHVAAKSNVVKKSLLGDDDLKRFAAGRQIYLNTCSGCHGADGAGLARFGPPLIASDWVTGDAKRLVLILLHGMEGPVEVKKKTYDQPDILPVMPAHSTMDDASLTAVLTYIRNEWDNDAGPIDRQLVGKTRVLTQGRVVPWTANELNKYIDENKEASVK